MAYTENEKSTGLDALTDIAQNDLVIFGDVSDSGFAKAITKENLEIDIANSPTFINNLVANSTFITGSNPLTTKGDIYIRGTTGVARLPVGADGQVLSADSTVANGLIWADVQAGGGGGGTKLAIDTNEVTVTATVAETTLFTVPIPAGTLGTNDAIRFFIYGTMQNPGTFTFRVKYGATTLTTFTHTLNSNSVSYNALLKGIIVADNSLSAQKAQTEFIAKHNPNAGFEGKTGIGTSVINSTLAHDLVITVQNSDVAGTITVESILVEKLSSSQDGIVIYPDASEDLVIGTPVGISNGLNSVAKASTNFKSVSLPSAGNNQSIFPFKESFATLGNSKYAFLTLNNNTTTLRVFVSTINRNTMTPTVGTGEIISSDIIGNQFAIVKLDTDKFVVLYRQTASNTILRAIVCTVSGTTITASSPVSLYTAGSNIANITASFLGTDKFVLFTKSTTNADNVGIVCTVSGTTITAGTAQTPPSDTGIPESVIRIDVDKFALAGRRLSPADGTVVVGTIAGTVITFGTAVQFVISSNIVGNVGIASHTDNAFVVSWGSGIFGTPLDLIAGTVSGTTVTLGTAIVSASNVGGYVIKYSNNVVAIAGEGSPGSYLSFYTVTGASLTFLKRSSFVQSIFSIVNIALMEDGYYVITNQAIESVSIFIEGMSNNFIGVVQNTVSRNGTAIVRISGIDANQTGLTAGEVYVSENGVFVQKTIGTVLNIARQEYVRAISSTTISI